MNEKVDMKEGCERRSFLFATVEWQDNNVIYSVWTYDRDLPIYLSCADSIRNYE